MFAVVHEHLCPGTPFQILEEPLYSDCVHSTYYLFWCSDPRVYDVLFDRQSSLPSWQQTLPKYLLQLLLFRRFPSFLNSVLPPLPSQSSSQIHSSYSNSVIIWDPRPTPSTRETTRLSNGNPPFLVSCMIWREGESVNTHTGCPCSVQSQNSPRKLFFFYYRKQFWFERWPSVS